MRIWGLIAAAGVGARFGSERPKQYTLLAGTPIISRSLTALCRHADIDWVIAGIAPVDAHWRELKFSHPKFARSYDGGATRADTVRLGLQKILADDGASDLVAVHDAARPLLNQDDLSAVIGAAKTHHDGAILGIPVTDAVKRVNPEGQIQSSLDRTGLWRALTPQVFRVDMLAAALAACHDAGETPLDEADAIQFIGGKPRMVQGRADNIKITLQRDLSFAQRLVDANDD